MFMEQKTGGFYVLMEKRKLPGDTRLEKIRECYLKNRQKLYVYAFNILKNAEDAEDAVHTAFEHIWVKIQANGFFPKNMTAYVYRIVYRSVIDKFRKTHPTIPLEQPVTDELTIDISEGLMEYLDIKTLIGQLEQKDQTIVILRIYAELGFRQIGMVIDLPVFTVATRYYRAIRVLKKELEKKHG